MSAELTALLGKLAEGLGVTVDVLWAALLRQAPISAATSVAVWSALFAISLALFLVGRRLSGRADWGADEDPAAIGAVIVYVISAILLFALFGSAAAGLERAVAALFNPEYWALLKILELL